MSEHKHESLMKHGFEYDETFNIWVQPEHHQIISLSVLERLSDDQFAAWAGFRPVKGCWVFWVETLPEQVCKMVDHLATLFG